jgi:hypothetical protein
MAFDDLRKLLDSKPLVLPIGAKKYTIEHCNAEDWLRLQEISNRLDEINRAIQNDELEKLSDATGITSTEVFRLGLGDAFDKMVKDGIRGDELAVAGWTAYFWQLGNEKMAEFTWQNAGKALVSVPQNRASRRAAAKSNGSTSHTRRATGASTRGQTARS